MEKISSTFEGYTAVDKMIKITNNNEIYSYEQLFLIELGSFLDLFITYSEAVTSICLLIF